MRKSTTNFSVDKVPKVIRNLSSILQDSLPNSIYGILSTAEEVEQGLLIGKKWILRPVAKASYNIIDADTGEESYVEIARMQTAISIINLLVRCRNSSIAKVKVLQAVDQTYYRCLVDIAFYKQKIELTSDYDKRVTMQFRLEDKLYKLAEIKQQLFKLYC
jgi:hypothetical protein